MENVAVELKDLQRRQTVSEHRISDLEGEVKDIRQLTTAVVQANEKIDHMKCDVTELKSEVKSLSSRPGKLWDKIASAALGAIATGLVAAILALILRGN